MRPAAAEFCEKFEATYPDVTEIVKSLDESTSTDADAELIEELEEQVHCIILYAYVYYEPDRELERLADGGLSVESLECVDTESIWYLPRLL